MILITVGKGQEVIAALTEELARRGVRDGAIVSLIGGVEGCVISTMAADDFTHDVLTEYSQPAELSGTGDITEGTVHLHVVLGLQGDRTRSGHLHRANVVNFFVHAYVIPL